MPTPSDGRRPTNQTRRKSYGQNRTENVSATPFCAEQNSKVIGGISLPSPDHRLLWMIFFLQGLGDADTEYLEAGGCRGNVSRTEQHADSGDAGVFFLFRRLRRGSKSSRQARSIQRGFGFGADGPVWWLCRSQLLGRCVYPRCSNVPECHCSNAIFSFIFNHKLAK